MEFVAEVQVCVTSEHDCRSLAVGKNILLLLIVLKKKEKSREGDSLVHQMKTHNLQVSE